MLMVLKNKNRLLVVTIPDYSLSPEGKIYGLPSTPISTFNDIIKNEAQKRELMVVDIFPLSRTLALDPKMFADDGLHPSVEQLIEWEKIVAPVALSVINHGMVKSAK